MGRIEGMLGMKAIISTQGFALGDVVAHQRDPQFQGIICEFRMPLGKPTETRVAVGRTDHGIWIPLEDLRLIFRDASKGCWG